MNTYRYQEAQVTRSMILPLLISSIAVLTTLVYASFRDIKERRVPFRTWYPMLAIGLPAVVWFYLSLLQGGDWQPVLFFLILTGLFSLIFYLFAVFHLFGGADAWALIFIATCIPTFPHEPALGYPPFQYFPLTVLINALILNLVAPVAIFLVNIIRRDYAPFPYMFLGFPVRGDEIQQAFGFVMEDIHEEDGRITRRFIKISEAFLDLLLPGIVVIVEKTVAVTTKFENIRIFNSFKGKPQNSDNVDEKIKDISQKFYLIRIRDHLNEMQQSRQRIYTKDLARYPEDYAHELSLFRRAGTVWISWGVPFIVPITAGLITALLAGDLLFSVMMVLRGM